ncbi:hypothetical protein ETI06_06390 [Macrococcoides goetzii]|uniref:Uncharacterized protein n=1 Tax=Macrococcoides goetzii TaxID=1891097 RepID=A0A395GBQ1_9STAP|nr:hypothetical protein [Macrococcus goetzii]RAI81475.1 hypothetical protein BFS35_007860 [Macrococcus goetzii]TDM40690.1 hypothetical protein ETI10_08630 [Macrococcus goetzii]TDM45272.1 hypothetical protein ETI08_07815 [Macrococcus goetzii]TDM49175.1 hypothetical protein ETI06_06390 [Macrococcus goetzii]
MKSKTHIYVIIMMLALVAINLYLSYYYIIGPGRGEVSWMGFVSLFAALMLIGLTYKYYQSQKKINMDDFNAHIKSDDDRIIK